MRLRVSWEAGVVSLSPLERTRLMLNPAIGPLPRHLLVFARASQLLKQLQGFLKLFETPGSTLSQEYEARVRLKARSTVDARFPLRDFERDFGRLPFAPT